MAAHDRARFEALFAAHYRDVHRYALRRTEPGLAEEVANEAFLVAWRRLDKVPREHPLPWLYAAAAHVLANQRRAEARHMRRSHAVAAERRPTGRDPADRLAERDVVLQAFATLSERDREALRLTAWERLSLADGARSAGVTRAAFAVRVSRARRRLAAALHARDAAIDLDHFLEPADV
ncbi:RNA polymerase sigma factor [Solirubrobacter soli]|uniref:RNA polymerase sigma factor n=1 Tax=Solirubrobacter soli TaxID=363832 RepID=UPI0004031D80|nr:sigma-70 family RNA polymerase sigma factor [Solirubrobacter soli]